MPHPHASGRDTPSDVFYSPDYVVAACDFDTTRKSAWIADSLLRRPIAGIRLIAPTPLSEADLTRVHAAEYVTAVKTGVPRSLAESNGLTWDPGVWTAVCASNGGVVAAVLEAM